ncbi:MAG: hypothetical protein M0032_05705 [Actinomycetota bacterium]|jgi:hypothetical protein|nr:hypothetical protein [Actinomycetota bacterium]MDA8293058.1 hypothetical protein [Actinomycetota bacterium]
MIFSRRAGDDAGSGPAPTGAGDPSEVAAAFTSTPTLFQLLATVRTRRMGLGYRAETGEEEAFSWSGDRTATQPEGPFAYASAASPVPLSETEAALLCWVAAGPNGMALADIPVQGALAGMLHRRGRTVPSSSGDLGVDLFVIDDSGVWAYRPEPDPPRPVEIRGPEDYGRILEWYRAGRVQVLDHRPDVAWPGAPEATHNVRPMGAGQYNLNRPGSTWLVPVGDVGLEWFNQLLVSYEWSGFYLQDPDTGDPAGCEEWIRPGFLEVGFPIPAFDELALLLHTGQVGCMVQNIRLACEALGLGAWATGSYADDFLLGAYPEISPGLGFSFLERDPATNPAKTSTCQGLAGVFEPVMVPSPRFPDAASAVRYVRSLREGPGGALDGAPDPWRPEVADEVRAHPRAHLSDWAEEAAIATVEHIVAKHGCCPAYVNPVRAKLSVQVHHVDTGFYHRYFIPDGGADGLTPAIEDHFATWHAGQPDPGAATGGERHA